MSNEIKNESTKVNEYLVDRIRKVEKENEELRNYCFKLETKAQRYDAIKSMICLEDGAVKSILVRDLDGAYIGLLATNYSDHYDEYLDLFDLREKE